VLVVPAVLLSACDSDDSTAAPIGDASTIAVRDYEFEPSTVSVGVGDTVTWVWEGGARHNVVGEGFESEDQSSGSFRRAFDEPGTYQYACTLHPGMQGDVVVEEREA
jgi:plastocyanin